MFSAVIQIARRVLYPKWECFRQSSAWICISVKHIDHCAAHSLSAQVGFQHGFYFSEPRHFYRSTVVKHNNGVRLCFRHRFNQCVLAVRHPKMLPVIPFGFKAVRQSGKDYRHVRICSSLYGFCSQCFIRFILNIIKTFGKCDVFLFYSCEKFYGVHCRFCFKAVDVGTSAALIAWFLGVFADKSHLFVCGQREKRILIFQKHNTLLFDFPGCLMVFFTLKYRVFVSVFLIFENNIQIFFTGLVQYRFIQCSVLYCGNDFCIRSAFTGRHFQIAACFQSFHTVIHRTPVCHYIAVKSPFPAEHICEHFFVFTKVCAVQLVVCVHNGPRLFLLYHSFKRSKVNFTHGAFIHF